MRRSLKSGKFSPKVKIHRGDMTVEQLQQTIQKIQADYQQKIQALMAAGQVDQMQPLMEQMQKELQNITQQFEAGVHASIQNTSPTENYSFLRSELTDLDLKNYMYTSDLKFFKDRTFLSKFEPLLADIREKNKKPTHRRALLANALRLTPKISPALWQTIEHCQKTLKLKIPMDVFVLNDKECNAFAYPLDEGRLTIGLTSGLLETLNSDELSNIIGHEIGHVLFGHTDISTRTLISDYDISCKDVLLLRSWSRAREISADRLGLLCCSSFEVACTSFFKVTSGINSPQFTVSMSSYMEQYSDLEQVLKTMQPHEMEEMYATHPLNPLRLRALQSFSECDVFLKTKGLIHPKPLTYQEAEQQIQSTMNLFEPTYLDDSGALAGHIRGFLFLAGYMISKSDGDVSLAEVQKLAELLGPSSHEYQLKELEGLEDKAIIERIVDLSGKLNFELPVVQKVNIVRDIFTIVTSDGTIAEGEVNTMFNVCSVLRLEPRLVHDLLATVEISTESDSAAA